jgi:hypothetical protein
VKALTNEKKEKENVLTRFGIDKSKECVSVTI